MSTSRNIGAMALLELGCSAWSQERRDHNDDPVGGVIVHVDDHVDRETGEKTRVLTTLNPYKPVHGIGFRHQLNEPEVDLETLEPADSYRLRLLIHRLAAEVAAKTKQGPVMTDTLDHIAAIHTLAGLL